jgi:hypothetical protein
VLLLPDLVQKPPSGLLISVRRAGPDRRFRLGFLSWFSNEGTGPLVVAGSRPSRVDPTMRADQLVIRDDGSVLRRRGIGSMRYVRAETHEHWHLLPFDRYELWPVGAPRRPIEARKSGFCLSDQLLDRAVSPRARPEKPVFTRECGRRSPGLLSVRHGLSVGWLDYYLPTLEGQSFDVTTLPSGDYVLVNTLNAEGLLRESDRTNDSASVRLHLSWPHGHRAKPRVRVVRVCPHSRRCPR